MMNRYSQHLLSRIDPRREYTAEEIQRLQGLKSIKTVYNWSSIGILTKRFGIQVLEKHTRDGKRLMFFGQDVIDFLTKIQR